MRGRAWLLFALPLFGCGSSSDGTNGGTADCKSDGTCPAALSCNDDEHPSADGASCVKVGWQNCPPGFALDATGYGCIDVSPPDDCAAGTMPTIGDVTCKPAGTTSCASGFTPDASGWGCDAIVPPASCSGATIEKLGSATCAPVGDCNATFPPAGATLFVNASGPSDGTHFTTIGAAIAAATDGVTISIDSGTYAESIALTHAVHLVGKCPAMVTVSEASPATAGISIAGVSGASVSGITITGHLPGVKMTSGSLTLTSVVIDGNSSAGISAAGASTLEVDDSVIRSSAASTSPAGDGDGVDVSMGASVTMKRSAVVSNVASGIFATDASTSLTFEDGVVTDTRVKASGDYGVGIDVVTKAKADILRSYVARNHEAGLVSAALSELAVDDSVIEGNLPSSAGFGRGITNDGGNVTIENVTVDQNVDVGIASEAKGTLDAKNSVFRAQKPNADRSKGAGVSASSGAQVTLTSVALVGNSEEGAFSDGAGSSLTMTSSIARDGVMLAGNTAGNGAVAQNGGKLILDGSALVANHESGLLLFDAGSSANVSRSIIARQLTSMNQQFGRGIVLQNGPTLTMNQSVVANNTDIAFSARGAGTNATIAQSVFRDTDAQPLDGTHGRGLNVIESATATITDCEVYGNQEVAALVSGSNASLTATTSVFAGTRLDTKLGSAGRGFAAQLNAIGAITGCAILDNFQVGVSSSGAGGALSLTESLVDGTKPASGDFGHGAISYDGASLTLATSTFRNNHSAGVLVDAAAATVSACKITSNAVGINVQDGATLVQAATVPSPPNPLEVDVSNDTVFDGNQTRVGSDQLPIPGALN